MEVLIAIAELSIVLFGALLLVAQLLVHEIGFRIGLRRRLAGAQAGLKEKPMRILIGLLSLMWTVVIVDILDLSAARLGNFRTGALAYEWTAQGFRGGIVVPPLPGTP